MYPRLSLSSLFYMVGYPVALVALALLISRSRRSRLEKALFICAALLLLARSAWLLARGFLSWDLERMHHAATNALNGASPYEVQTFLYLPTSLPIFELFALVPFPTMQRIWLIANTVMLLILPYVSWVVLKRSGPIPRSESALILMRPRHASSLRWLHSGGSRPDRCT